MSSSPSTRPRAEEGCSEAGRPPPAWRSPSRQPCPLGPAPGWLPAARRPRRGPSARQRRAGHRYAQVAQRRSRTSRLRPQGLRHPLRGAPTHRQRGPGRRPRHRGQRQPDQGPAADRPGHLGHPRRRAGHPRGPAADPSRPARRPARSPHRRRAGRSRRAHGIPATLRDDRRRTCGSNAQEARTSSGSPSPSTTRGAWSFANRPVSAPGLPVTSRICARRAPTRPELA